MSGLFQRGWSKALKWFVIAVVTVLVVAILALDVLKIGSVALPPVQPVQVTTLEQGWRPGWDVGEAQWFHHASQGTKILDYRWFMALEQPELSVLRRPGLISSSAYLQRFGFLASPAHAELNPDGLPLGFAIERVFQEPYASAPPPYPVVGLTWRGCHTAQVNYDGQGIHIDGGPAMVDLEKFQDALGRAVFYTKILPWRFNRFARRVLKDEYNSDSKAALRAQLDVFLAKGLAAKEYADKNRLYDLKSGFGRTDALDLILNRVFEDLNEENLGEADAPVNFPHIWDSPWFEWVQYDRSIRTPMARNIGEALGVGALLNFPGRGGVPWNSTVNVTNLHLMEEQLAGDEPFGGLTSPVWPEKILGEINQDLMRQGKQLYETHCAQCHWRTEDLKAAYRGDDPQGMWTKPNRHDKSFIDTSRTSFNVEMIGTDASQAMNFAQRVVVTRPGLEVNAAGPQLDYVTNRVRELEYRNLGLLQKGNEARKYRYDAYRVPWDEYALERVAEDLTPGELDQLTNGFLEADFKTRHDAIVLLEYKSRPLNGIWATAPYLHNGSVMNLYEMLVPVAERTVRFNVGSKEFDPINVGFVNERLRGGFELDTTLKGNRNTGHEFRDRTAEEKQNNGGWVKGVIGPALSHDERMAIIEYLKSL